MSAILQGQIESPRKQTGSLPQFEVDAAAAQLIEEGVSLALDYFERPQADPTRFGEDLEAVRQFLRGEHGGKPLREATGWKR